MPDAPHTKLEPGPLKLTVYQMRQLAVILSVLDLHVLLQLAWHVKQICAQPGWGRVTIVIQKGRPDGLEAVGSEKLLPSIDAEHLAGLMGE